MTIISDPPRGHSNIVVIQGGQTGVDRGAHVGATDNGWPVRGYMPKNGADENGPIPVDVAKHLVRCLDSGLPSRTRCNVNMSQAVLVVVADEDDPRATPGTKLTLDLAAEMKRPRLVVDPRRLDATDRVVAWIRQLCDRASGGLQLARDFRLMVAGPRASRWASGQVETAGLLRRVHAELQRPIQRRCRVYGAKCINQSYCDARDACCAGDPACQPA